MKIVIVHYRYFISGGPERYLFNIKEVLEQNGHEVIPFSIKHNRNLPSKYEGYFLDPIGDGDEVYSHEYKKDIKTVGKVLSRMIYSNEAKKKITRLLNEVKPDLIYVLHFQNKISFSVIDAADKLKIPVVQRISDFGHICANNVFYLYDKGEICERCLKGSKWNSVIHKCVYDSYIYSFIKFISLSLQDMLKVRDKISAFVIPSKFTISKFVEYGVKEDKIYHIPTFFNKSTINDSNIEYHDFVLYIGRVDQDKGLMTLIKAFERSKRKLIIIGDSSSNYNYILQKYLDGKDHNIEFIGKLAFTEIQEYLRTCLFTICPSEWYDNFPNTILESFAFKKMVIASNIGSLTELVEHKYSGLLFQTGNWEELEELIEVSFINKTTTINMGIQAYEKLSTEYSSELHYSRLLTVFNKLIDENNRQVD
jgi:glycosyltransferase involved in cell wall biosynthesis